MHGIADLVLSAFMGLFAIMNPIVFPPVGIV